MYQRVISEDPNATYLLRGRGYKNEDLKKMVSTVAGADMSDFFKRYVRGVESPPYAEAFANVACVLYVNAVPVWVGISGDENDPNNFKVAAVRPGSARSGSGFGSG